MHSNLIHYQSANISDEQSIQGFIVRKKEFERIISDIQQTDKNSSLQHYVFIGRRGSGKSTLLRRIQAEISTDSKLSNRFLVINLSEEQAGIYQLYDLWDYVIRDLNSKGGQVENIAWEAFKGDMKAYTHALYAQVRESLKKANKQLVLLIDNIERIFDNIGDQAALFREQLMNYNDVRIIGGSTNMADHYWKYEMPFYQFFSIKKLKPLEVEEIKQLLRHWAEEKELPEIASFVNKHPGKIQAIRMLTDGTPRTMLLFVDMLINRPLQNGFDYLHKIIDQATPIYQERLGTLSPQQKKILAELSFFWEATSVEQLISVCKMSGKTISAQLNKLIKLRMVEKIKGPTKNHFYRLEERFFNLWLLMTQGGPKQKRDAKYLTVFLENWYDQQELKRVYREFLSSLKENTSNPSYTASMTKALAHSRYISLQERDEIISTVLSTKISDELKLHIPELSSDIIAKVLKLCNDNQLKDAYQLAQSIEQEDLIKYAILGIISYDLKDYTQAEEYFLHAINKGDTIVIGNLATLYKKQGKTDEAEKYFLLAIDNDDTDAINSLAILYDEQGKTDEAEKYFLLAIDKDDINASNNLAILYEGQGRVDEAEKYFLFAIGKGQDDALLNLAILYDKQDRVNEAEEYFLQAIDKGYTAAIVGLANTYEKQGKVDEAEKYLKLAINKGDTLAINNLAIIYDRQGKEDEAEKYFKLAIDKGQSDALFNLAIFYYIHNKDKKDARELINRFSERTTLTLPSQLIIKNTIDLWSGQLDIYMEERKMIMIKLIEHKQKEYLRDYFVSSLIHQQKNYLFELFEESEYGSYLKSILLPLYYVTLKLINPLDPRLLKTPPELEENIEDIFLSIKFSQEFYYGKNH